VARGDGTADFAQTIATAYAVDGAALDLGRGVHTVRSPGFMRVGAEAHLTRNELGE
jgi:hypothetical protein